MSVASRINCSYGQFLVRDESVMDFAFVWTHIHIAQGFARQNSAVSFASIVDNAAANLVVHFDAYRPDDRYDRVIAVPFSVVSGNVIAEGPEDANLTEPFSVPAGHYRLVSAQRHLTEDEGPDQIDIDLFFEKCGDLAEHSEILVADEQLSPPVELAEHAKLLAPQATQSTRLLQESRCR